MPDAPPNSDDARAAWWQALRRTVNRLIDALESADRADPGLSRDLQTVLGGWIDAATAPPPAPSDAAPPSVAPPPKPRPVEASSPPRMLVAPLPSPLTGPQVVAPPPSDYPREWTAEPFDPAGVAARCRLKARATRWQVERSRRLDSNQDVADGDAEIRNAARETGTFLWMINPQRWRSRPTAESVEIVAGCYDALAEASELMALADQLEREQETALKLLGEAQSSVRAAVEDYASTRRDDDQEAAFGWLRHETDRRRVYVPYMQLENPAPPEQHADLRRRVAEVRERLDSMQRRAREIQNALRRIEYHARHIADRPPGEPVPDPAGDADFTRICETVDKLLSAGVPPSDVRLRERILPIVDRIAEPQTPLPPAMSRVLSAVQDYVDQQQAEDERLRADANGRSEASDELIAAARQRVLGRDAVLIGGVPSEPHRQRLIAGLGLRSLDWVRVEHHEPFDSAETAIRRPGVNLVMIMTRWRSHRDGPAARAACRTLGIPLVELPAGYNLRQVAYRLVEQLPPPPPADATGAPDLGASTLEAGVA